MSLKIAVIDDERPARKELIRQILEVMPEAKIQEADSGSAALELMGSSPELNLLFIDISLTDMSGTTLAGAAKKLLPQAKIVFATAYSQYAARAFEMEIDDYILKPFHPDRVRRVLEKCRQMIEKEQNEASPEKPRQPETVPAARPAGAGTPRMTITVNRAIVFLDIPQIVYAETCGRGTKIHTTGREYETSMLLGDLEKQLQSYGFFRIHKCYLVNPGFIVEMFPWTGNGLALKMKGFENIILPVGRERLKGLKQLLGI